MWSNWYKSLGFCFIIVAIACQKKTINRQIIIDNDTPFSKYVTVKKRIAEGKEKYRVDTFIVKENLRNFIIDLKTEEENLYDIGLAHGTLSIPLITDTKAPKIVFNNSFPALYKLENSPASLALQEIVNKQQEFIEQQQRYSNQLSTIVNAKDKQKLLTSLQELDKMQQNWLVAYANNATNPFVFLVAYHRIEFGNRFKELKQMMLMAKEKFAANKNIQKLVTETMEYVKIFEEEFEIGNRLPEVNTNAVSTTAPSYGASAYTLVDFWGTWYNESMRSIRPKMILSTMYPPSDLTINSIALDMDRTIWTDFVKNNKLRWNNFIDTAVWQGPTLKHFKIDSIPFNFLVDRQGIIVAKAIPADSLIPVIKRYFNK